MIRQLLSEWTKLIDSCAEVVITSGNATPCAVMNADICSNCRSTFSCRDCTTMTSLKLEEPLFGTAQNVVNMTLATSSLVPTARSSLFATRWIWILPWYHQLAAALASHGNHTLCSQEGCMCCSRHQTKYHGTWRSRWVRQYTVC